MLQVLMKKGKVFVENVPRPNVSPGSVLIKVVCSCISAGTEISMVQASGMSLFNKLRSQPEKLGQAFNMLRTHGFAKLWDKVVDPKSIGSPIGYSLSGVVIGVGEGVFDLETGDRVAAAGAGYANHAEYVDVPRNLVMRMPDSLDFESAATTTLGGIALQGIRRANIQLGEYVLVFGTGILGLLTLQLAKAAGGRCIAVDIDQRRLDLAKKFGAELTINQQEVDDQFNELNLFTGGHGADVTIFVAATSNPKVLSQAFSMTRKKGRLVMVGVYGNELNRDDIYKKELDFLISTSYGPGRYDNNYEERGLDYPYAYIRWTENRNMEEYLRLLDNGQIDVKSMIDGQYSLNQVAEAFKSLNKSVRPLLVLLNYGELTEKALIPYQPKKTKDLQIQEVVKDKVRVGLVGAGTFARAVHLPNLAKLGDKFALTGVCCRRGASAKEIASRFGVDNATTDYNELLKDENVDLIMVCTRHNLHGRIVLDALEAGKHVFVEKPLCTKPEELNAIRTFFNQKDGKERAPMLTVGFNRRFSKYAQIVKKHIQKRIGPLFIHYRMNAGYIPTDHWVHTEEGGGRIIGEACHIIDLFSFLTESPVKSVAVASLHPKNDSLSATDNKSILLEYKDGSVATLHYFAVGSKNLPKEHLEVHFDGKTLIVEDYKSIIGHGLKVENLSDKMADKGLMEELLVLHECLHKEGSKWPISLDSLLETTEITFIASGIQTLE